MPPFAVRITVAGRVGPVLGSVFARLDVETTPRHTVVRTGPSGAPEVVRLLRALERAGVEVESVLRSG